MYEDCPSTGFDSLVLAWSSDPCRRIPKQTKERLISNAVRALEIKRKFHAPFTAAGHPGSKISKEDRVSIRAIDELLADAKAIQDEYQRGSSPPSCVSFRQSDTCTSGRRWCDALSRVEQNTRLPSKLDSTFAFDDGDYSFEEICTNSIKENPTDAKAWRMLHESVQRTPTAAVVVLGKVYTLTEIAEKCREMSS